MLLLFKDVQRANLHSRLTFTAKDVKNVYPCQELCFILGVKIRPCLLRLEPQFF